MTIPRIIKKNSVSFMMINIKLKRIDSRISAYVEFVKFVHNAIPEKGGN